MSPLLLAVIDENTIIGYFVSGIIVLGSAVGLLWRSEKSARVLYQDKLGKDIEEAKADAKACEERHAASEQRILELTSRVSGLEGHKEGVRDLAQELLDLLRKHNVVQEEADNAPDSALHPHAPSRLG